MEKQHLQNLFNRFLSSYDAEAKDAIWEQQSKQFRQFWDSKIINSRKGPLDDFEIDEIVKILDRHGKGNTKESEAVARVMIPQGAWRRMFNELKNKPELSGLLNDILIEKGEDRQAAYIDKLYKLNQGRHNNLTGQSGNAVNAMLAAYDPFQNVSVISLKDRRMAIESLQFDGGPNFDIESVGKKIVRSNAAIISGFRNAGVSCSARTVSAFLYSAELKPLWRSQLDDDPPVTPEPPFVTGGESIPDPAQFYMESQLEDFLIENWDRTELGRKYDLIEEQGELISQQYRTGIGIIDILAMDKRNHQYVVIELKKGQTSDDTVGQITRYMGWLEEHKTDGKPTKGIIIASQYDQKLYYALKKLKDIEVYLYKVDFKLQEFRGSK